MVDYIKAIKRPFSDITKLVIGILLHFIPIVNFINFGYGLECSKSAMEKKFKLPEYKQFWRLFVKGLVSILIGIIYFIPGLIFFLWGMVNVGIAILLGLSENDIEAIMTLVNAGSPLLITGLFLFFVAGYILPIALMNYSIKYKFKDGFDFRKIFRKIFTGKYFLVWLVTLIITWVLGMTIGLIPFVGYAIAGFISIVIGYTLYGQVYKEIK